MSTKSTEQQKTQEQSQNEAQFDAKKEEVQESTERLNSETISKSPSEEEKKTLKVTDEKPSEEKPTDETPSDEMVISFFAQFVVNTLLENKNQRSIRKVDKGDPLFSRKVPVITIEAYLRRIVKYAQLEHSTVVVALLLLRRFITQNCFVIAFNNIYNLILGIFLLAIKLNEETHFKNAFYGKIAGLGLEQTNLIEYTVLSRLNFSLHVPEVEYRQGLKEICAFFVN